MGQGDKEGWGGAMGMCVVCVQAIYGHLIRPDFNSLHQRIGVANAN